MLDGAERRDEVLDDDGRQPLRRLVDQEQALRVHEGARDGEHLLLASGQRARARAAKPVEIREEREHPSQPLAAPRVLPVHGHAQVLLDRQRREDPLALGNEAYPEPRDVIGRHPLDRLALEADRALRRVQEPHDAAHGGGLAGSVAPQQHRDRVPLHADRHTLEDVVLADIRVDVFDLEDGLAHASGRRPRLRQSRRPGPERSC